MFVSPSDKLYEGMIIGIHSRDNDLVVNPIKGKQLTNVRASAPTKRCASSADRAHARVCGRVHRRRRAGGGHAEVDPHPQAPSERARAEEGEPRSARSARSSAMTRRSRAARARRRSFSFGSRSSGCPSPSRVVNSARHARRHDLVPRSRSSSLPGSLVAVLARMGSPAARASAAAREAMDIRTRLEVLKEATSDFERDLRQDLANARSEQAARPWQPRTELGDRPVRAHANERAAPRSDTRDCRAAARCVAHENAQKLDQMRATVDEKLQGTLEERLGESFKQVSDRLEQVHKGLGEMQIARRRRRRPEAGADQRQAARQLGRGAARRAPRASADAGQYGNNVETRSEGWAERVEFAVRMPGRDETGAVLAADRRQVPARGLAAAAGGDGARRRRAVEAAARRSGISPRAGAHDPRQVRRAAAHDRLRDPVPADRRPVRRGWRARAGRSLQRDIA